MPEMTEAQVQRLLSGIDTLPTLPPVIARLTGLIENPNTSAAQITDLVSEDQSMTAKILKLANSAYYGFQGQVSTIKQAVVLLGFSSIRDVALSASVVDIFRESLGRGSKGGGRAHGEFNLVKFWEHSIGAGVAARVLARRLKLADNEEELFVVGLLHDIGKLVLHQHMPVEFERIISAVAKMDCLFIDAEKEAGLSHALIGKCLAEKWQLPKDIAEAVGMHHAVKVAAPAALKASIAHFADIATRARGVGSGGDSRIPHLANIAWDTLGLSERDFPEIISEFDSEMVKAEVFLEMIR